MLGTQIPSIQVLGFTYGTEILGGGLKNSPWKVFKKGLKLHAMSHVKLCSWTTYHNLLAELPNDLYTHKLPMGFQEQLAHLPSSWVVSKATSPSQHLAE